MKRRGLVAFVFALVVFLGPGNRSWTGPNHRRTGIEFELVVNAGRTCGSRSIDAKGSRGRTASVSDARGPVYSTIVLCCLWGTKALGHVEKLEAVSKNAQAQAMLGGDFTPLRYTRLQFDSLVLPDGNTLRIAASVKSIAENVSRKVAASDKSRTSRVRDAATQQVQAAIEPFTATGKKDRLKDWALSKLPYHPQYLRKGTVYTVELLEPLNFGVAVSSEWAPEGTMPPPESVLEAQLMTALDSAKTPRGTAIVPS